MSLAPLARAASSSGTRGSSAASHPRPSRTYLGGVQTVSSIACLIANPVFFSIFLGISTNFYLAAVCYGLVLPCAWSLNRRRLSMTTPLEAEQSENEKKSPMPRPHVKPSRQSIGTA